MSGPLGGLRVVDLSERSPAAAIAGMVLADLGAEVIRIEPPGGDPIRHLEGASVWFRGQRSVQSDELPASDLGDLCRSADVLVDTLHARRAGSPWSGPAGADQVVFLLTSEPADPESIAIGGPGVEDLHGEVIEARYGLQTAQVGHRQGPIFNGWPLAVNGAAWLVEIGTLAALHERERSGRGALLTASLADGVAVLSTHRWVGSERIGLGFGKSTIGGPGTGNRVVVTGLVRCRDQRWIQIHTGARGAFDRLFTTLDRPDLAAPEPGIAGNELSPGRIAAIWEVFAAEFPHRTSDEWVRILGEADVSAMPVLEPGAALRLPQLEANGLVEVDGERRTIGVTANFAATPARPAILGPPVRSKPREARAATSGAARGGPLDGLLVLDFGIWIAGPFANRMFADLGARVVKVEEVRGDPLRANPRHFLSSQRGKESLAIDLKTEAGQEVVHRLVRRADVVHHNMRLGVMERLGMGYEQLRALKPDLIYCHSSGYGNRGDWARLPAFEPLHSAIAGLLARTGGPGRPPLHYLTHMDFGCALTSATAVLAALWHRDRTGEGQYLECPQVGSALLAMADVHLENGTVHESFGIDPDQRGHAPTNALYECSDGWLAVAAGCDRDWVALHDALELDTRSTYDEARSTRLDLSADAGRIQEKLRVMTVDQAGSRLAAAGVAHAVPGVIDAEEDLMATPFARSGGVETSVHPEHGNVFAVGETIHFAGRPRTAPRRGPGLGEHTESLLIEVGFDERERAALFAGGVVRGDRSGR